MVIEILIWLLIFMQDDAVKLVKNIARQYMYLKRKLGAPKTPLDPSRFTWNAFRWAVSILMTRQNFIPSQHGNQIALIPLWDLCNHTHAEVRFF
jgi:hypothetical protein